jgi:DNA-binding LacI/PurR family transcriptional regulator
VILLDVSMDDERLALVRDLAVPSVVVGVPGEAGGLTCVDLDFAAAARMSIDSLADAGHRSIALLGHPQAVYERGSNFPHRFRNAFLEYAAERGLHATFVMPGSSDADVRRAVDEVLGPKAGVTAVVMHCEESIQSRALTHIADRGLSVPADLSVISACSSFDTSSFHPPLDVIPLVAADSCDRAVALVMEALDGSPEPHVELVEPRYISRSSIGEPAHPAISALN